MIGLLATVCAIAKCTELPALGKTTNPTCKYERSELQACEYRNPSFSRDPQPNLLNPTSQTCHFSIHHTDHSSLSSQTTEPASQFGSAPSSTPA
jgi:hypothetical protein